MDEKDIKKQMIKRVVPDRLKTSYNLIIFNDIKDTNRKGIR